MEISRTLLRGNKILTTSAIKFSTQCISHKSCKGKFLTEAFLISQEKKHEEPCHPLVVLKSEARTTYKAEATLVQFTKIHLESYNKKYMERAKKILLTLFSEPLFDANVLHHKSCYGCL